MALNITVKKMLPGFEGELVANSAYCKVRTISGSKSFVTFDLVISAGDTDIEVRTFSFTPNVEVGSSNFIAQSYEYVKTLPEFSNAVDC